VRGLCTASKRYAGAGLMFPGQGSQKVGMGKDLVDRFAGFRQTIERVDAALGEKVCTGLMLDGPQVELNKTENAQVALLGYSCGLWQVLQDEFGMSIEDCTCVLGHSLGEFSSLVATKVLSLEDAAKIVRSRGRAMQQASDAYFTAPDTFSMKALMGVNEKQAEMACSAALSQLGKPGYVCQVANINGASQVVISGTKVAVEAACTVAKKKFKMRRAVGLSVSAPFHSDVMKGALPALEEAFNGASWSDPCIPIISNVVGSPIRHASDLKPLLLEQLHAPVYWSRCVETAVSSPFDCRTLIELGHKTLGPLAGRIIKADPRLSVLQIKTLSATTLVK